MRLAALNGERVPEPSEPQLDDSWMGMLNLVVDVIDQVRGELSEHGFSKDALPEDQLLLLEIAMSKIAALASGVAVNHFIRCVNAKRRYEVTPVVEPWPIQASNWDGSHPADAMSGSGAHDG